MNDIFHNTFAFIIGLGFLIFVRTARDRRRPGLRAAEMERGDSEARSEEVQHPYDAGPLFADVFRDRVKLPKLG